MRKEILYMEIKKERNSSLELLRIICIVLIIAHHYGIHGGYEEYTYEAIPSGWMFIQGISMFGRLACAVFALISGFFLIHAGKERHYRKLVPLIAAMTFYSVLINAVCAVTGFGEVTTKMTLRSFFPDFWGNWYVDYYIVFFALIPFLNPMLTSLSQKRFTQLLIVVYLLWSVLPTFTMQAWEFSRLDFFLVMYMTGAYIRLYVHGKVKYNNRWNLVVALVSAALIELSVVAFNMLDTVLKTNRFVGSGWYFSSYNAVPGVIFAVSIFLYFSNLEFHSKPVNLIAGSVIGIYVIHDNALIRRLIWQTLWPNPAYAAAPYLHALVKIVSVFVVCLGIDLIRRATFSKVFDRWFYKHCDAMWAWIRAKLPGPFKALINREDG